jgi:hypothetical protein
MSLYCLKTIFKDLMYFEQLNLIYLKALPIYPKANFTAAKIYRQTLFVDHCSIIKTQFAAPIALELNLYSRHVLKLELNLTNSLLFMDPICE